MIEEARENLKDALRMVLEANREASEKEQEATTREELCWFETHSPGEASSVARVQALSRR